VVQAQSVSSLIVSPTSGGNSAAASPPFTIASR
jgi:hypothetical protein